METHSFVLVISVVVLAVAYLYQSHIISTAAEPPPSSNDTVQCKVGNSQDAVQHLQTFLTFNTVSDHSQPSHIRQPEQFDKLWEYAEATYPSVWKHLVVEKAGEGGYSRLFTWQGSDAAKKPVLFISHVDVVPAQPENLDKWTYPPFSGALADGYVWGRGAMDVKVTVVAMLEAVTQLLQEGYQPSRTLLFAYGHDEEVGGKLGAGSIAQLLKGRVGELEVVVDEGTGVVLDGMGVLAPYPVALVSTAEKGWSNVVVDVEAVGGHSSMPPYDGSTTLEAASRLVTVVSAPPPAILQPPMTDFLKALAPAAPSLLRPLLVHCDKPVLSNVLATVLTKAGKETGALVRNTAVVTRLNGGVADNVIPSRARILFNFRTLPGFSIQATEDAVRAAARSLSHLANVNFTVVANASNSNVASAVVPPTNKYFKLIKKAIQESWEFDGKPLAVAPFLLSGGTDSKHYGSISRNGILRFVPVEMNVTAGDVSRVHGIDERVSVANYERAICAYVRLQKAFGEA